MGYDVFVKKREQQGGFYMRHFYLRLLVGMVWLAAAIVSAMKGNMTMLAVGGGAAAGFLYSAYTIWKKEKGGKE